MICGDNDRHRTRSSPSAETNYPQDSIVWCGENHTVNPRDSATSSAFVPLGFALLNIVASTQSLSRLSIPRLRSSPVKCRNIRLVALLLLKNHEPSLYVAPIASDGEYHAAALSVRLTDATGPLLMSSPLTYTQENSAGKRSARYVSYR